ncbi:MAG: porphobilinogen synthase [Verrucomicrobiales bacterium]|jgi:porphobilinogen synthase|nr:porphobilinogen synthase [Verrucomicrobiales bacterium]
MNSSFSFDILKRPRRNRRNAAIRSLLTETHLSPSQLVFPVFVKDGTSPSEDIASLPGIKRYNRADLLKECKTLLKLGVSALALFPVVDPALKDANGKESRNPDNLLNSISREIKQRFPEMVLIADVALDPYTTHGHDGILDANGDVANDPTVEALMSMATLQAEAGIDYVAPSDMMDGRIGAIRRALDAKDFSHTGIIAYSAKFASAFYGPFRDAIGSQRPPGSYLDKKTYQLNPPNPREAIRDALLDEEEGADSLMVKPAGLYLDIIAKLREKTNLPISAYQISGEYAQIHATAQRGWLNLEAARDESLIAIKRAGADFILTYFAKSYAESYSR